MSFSMNTIQTQPIYLHSTTTTVPSPSTFPSLTAKPPSPSPHPQKLQQHPATLHGYRHYEYIPDHEHSNNVATNYYEAQQQDSNQNDQEDYYDGGSLESARKLQAAYLVENMLSRWTAGLFIGCWEGLKALVVGQKEGEYIGRRGSNQKGFNQLKQDQGQINKDDIMIQDQDLVISFNGKNNNNINTSQTHPLTQQQQPQSIEQHSQQPHPTQQPLQEPPQSITPSIHQRKQQIIQRQQQGITLDSLQKQRLNRSKSANTKTIPAKKDNKDIPILTATSPQQQQQQRQCYTTTAPATKLTSFHENLHRRQNGGYVETQRQQQQQLSDYKGRDQEPKKGYREKYEEYYKQRNRSMGRGEGVGEKQQGNRWGQRNTSSFGYAVRDYPGEEFNNKYNNNNTYNNNINTHEYLLNQQNYRGMQYHHKGMQPSQYQHFSSSSYMPSYNNNPNPSNNPPTQFPSSSYQPYPSYQYPYNSLGHYNQLFSYKSPNATQITTQRSNYHLTNNNNSNNQHQGHQHNNPYGMTSATMKNQHYQYLSNMQEKIVADDDESDYLAGLELLRAKLYGEITEKLNFSRLRLVELGGGRSDRNDEEQGLEVMRKLTRLQRLVREVRREELVVGNNKNKKDSGVLGSTMEGTGSGITNNSKQGRHDNDQLLKQFVHQLQEIRREINQIKISSTTNQQQQQSIINSQYQLQQHHQYQQHQHQQQVLREKQYQQQQQNQQQNNPKANQHEQNQHQHDSHYQYQPLQQSVSHQNITTNINTTSVNTTSHNTSPTPPPTYRKILFDGRTSGYQQQQRQARQLEIRKMTQRVRLIRLQKQIQLSRHQADGHYDAAESQHINNRPIRQKYEEELMHRQQLQEYNRGFDREEEDDCCVLVNY